MTIRAFASMRPGSGLAGECEAEAIAHLLEIGQMSRSKQSHMPWGQRFEGEANWRVRCGCSDRGFGGCEVTPKRQPHRTRVNKTGAQSVDTGPRESKQRTRPVSLQALVKTWTEVLQCTDTVGYVKNAGTLVVWCVVSVEAGKEETGCLWLPARCGGKVGICNRLTSFSFTPAAKPP